MKYPEYVKEYRPKGTVVKQVNGIYYVYKATSKRVPDKKYPVQIVEGLVGKIDAFGYHPVTSTRVELNEVIVRECGFTNYLLKFEKNYISENNTLNKNSGRTVYRSLIAYLSPNSYLYEDDETKIKTPEELVEQYGIGIPNRIASIERYIGVELKKLEPLKYICHVRLSGKVLNSKLTEAQITLLEELGINEQDIR